MYINNHTTPKKIIFDITKNLCTSFIRSQDIYRHNWELVYPEFSSIADVEYPNFWSENTEDIDSFLNCWRNNENLQALDDVVLRCRSFKYKKPRILYVRINENNSVAISDKLLQIELRDDDNKPINLYKSNLDTIYDGSIKLFMPNQKHSFYRVNSIEEVHAIEFYIEQGTNKLIIPDSCPFGTKFKIELEEDISEQNIYEEYYLRLTKPKYIENTNSVLDGKENNHYLTWQIGNKFKTVRGIPEISCNDYAFVANTKWSWFKCSEESFNVIDENLPIEYWMNVDRDSMVAALRTNPKYVDYLSSFGYFGSLHEIKDNLTTSTKSEQFFFGTTGSDEDPTITNKNNFIETERGSSINALKLYGDYTGTGVSDVIMVASKAGRPYQGNKIGLYGVYEFNEQLINSNKFAVSEMIVADVYENERGVIYNSFVCPSNNKIHGDELVLDRYMDKEKHFIYLDVNTQYSIVPKRADLPLGVAIRINDSNEQFWIETKLNFEELVKDIALYKDKRRYVRYLYHNIHNKFSTKEIESLELLLEMI